MVLCPLTTTIRMGVETIRVDILPTPENGLRMPSQIAIDRLSSLLKSRVGGVIGKADGETMARVDTALLRFLGLG